MDNSDIEDEGLAISSMFPEPPRPPSPESTVSTYVRTRLRSTSEWCTGEGRSEWREIKIRLVGSHPLWGHYLWNAARSFATYLDENVELYRGRNVLELGAGGGLPGLVTVLGGARRTVLTDYPDKSLLDNLEYNVKQNIPEEFRAANNVFVEGYVWGTPVDRLLEIAKSEKYDLIILSDLVFNHSQHDALLKTCELTLRDRDKDSTSTENNDESQKPNSVPTVLVFYTHHRPHLASRDLEFFEKAQKRGWKCKEIITERYAPMFPNDPGDEEVRATVHGWALTR